MTEDSALPLYAEMEAYVPNGGKISLIFFKKRQG